MNACGVETIVLIVPSGSSIVDLALAIGASFSQHVMQHTGTPHRAMISVFRVSNVRENSFQSAAEPTFVADRKFTKRCKNLSTTSDMASPS